MAIGPINEKRMDKMLNPRAEYSAWKKAFEKGEEKKKPIIPKRLARFLSLSFFGTAALLAFSAGAAKYIMRPSQTPPSTLSTSPSPTYEEVKESKNKKEKREYRTNLAIAQREDEDHRAVVFLFGDSVGSSIIKWSRYFDVEPGIVVAILCAENGSSLDPWIVNTVSLRFMNNPHVADTVRSRSDARGIAQIKPSTAGITIKKLVSEGRWPFQTTEVDEVLSDYNMSIFLLCALIKEIQKFGWSEIDDIAGVYHSGINGWVVKKEKGQNGDEVWKHIRKAELAMKQYEGVRDYLSKR